MPQNLAGYIIWYSLLIKIINIKKFSILCIVSIVYYCSSFALTLMLFQRYEKYNKLQLIDLM